MQRTLSRIGRMAILVCLGGLGAFAWCGLELREKDGAAIETTA